MIADQADWADWVGEADAWEEPAAVDLSEPEMEELVCAWEDGCVLVLDALGPGAALWGPRGIGLDVSWWVVLFEEADPAARAIRSERVASLAEAYRRATALNAALVTASWVGPDPDAGDLPPWRYDVCPSAGHCWHDKHGTGAWESCCDCPATRRTGGGGES